MSLRNFKMKKHILVVFVSSSVLVLTACGGGDGDSTSVIVDDGIPKTILLIQWLESRLIQM